MRYRLHWWVVMVTCACLSVCVAKSFRDEETRDVAMVVSIRDDAGRPIDNVPLAVSRNSGLTFGKTDSQGNWSVTVRIAADSQQEFVKVTSHSLVFKGPDSTDSLSQRVREVKDAYAVPATILVPTATVQAQYAVTAVFPSAVHVSMVVSNGTNPLRAAVVVGGRDSVGTTGVDGALKIGGVVKGQDCTLFVREANKPGVRAIDLPASQLLSDVDIGTKVVTFPAATCACAFTATNVGSLKRDPLPTKGYVTAVSTNGQDLYGFSLNDESVCVDVHATDHKVRLPAGEYFLVPGNVGVGRYASAARKLLLDGCAADLQAAMVPRVVITSEQGTCSATVDMEAVRAAIAQLAGLSY